MDALCRVWLNLARWFCRRSFLDLINVFPLFCYYLPLVKDIVLHLNLNLFIKECFLPNLILKKKTFKLQYFLCAISNNLPLEMGVARHLNKFEPPPLPNLAYIDLVILEEKIFKYRKCIFLQIS